MFLISVCYNDRGQDLSICNYWNGDTNVNSFEAQSQWNCMICTHTDPKHQSLYQENSKFLYPLDCANTSGENMFIKEHHFCL